MNTETGSMVEGNPFKAGDIVRLRSGGPSMTVTKIVGWDTHCVWWVQHSMHNPPASTVLPFQALESAKAN